MLLSTRLSISRCLCIIRASLFILLRRLCVLSSSSRLWSLLSNKSWFSRRLCLSDSSSSSSWARKLCWSFSNTELICGGSLLSIGSVSVLLLLLLPLLVPFFFALSVLLLFLPLVSLCRLPLSVCSLACLLAVWFCVGLLDSEVPFSCDLTAGRGHSV